MILTIHNGSPRLTWTPVQRFLKLEHIDQYQLKFTCTSYVDPIAADVTISLYCSPIGSNIFAIPGDLVNPSTGYIRPDGFIFFADNKGALLNNGTGPGGTFYGIDGDGFPYWTFIAATSPFNPNQDAFSQMFYAIIDSNAGQFATNIVKYDFPIGDQ